MANQTCKLPTFALRMCPRKSFDRSISEQHSDLVSHLHIQTRLMGNVGLNGGIPWLCNTDSSICFLWKVVIETVSHFLVESPNFQEHVDSLWANLTVEVTKFNDIWWKTDIGVYHQTGSVPEALLIMGCLPLPFDAAITRFFAAAVGKIYKFCAESLQEQEAPWLSH